MASARWTDEDLARLSQQNGALKQRQADGVKVAQSKYRNVKTQAEGFTFDSKREAAYYLQLRMRERAGEINNLQTQVEYPLTCAADDGTSPIVAHYVADFVYFEKGKGLHVVDAKGKRTRMYDLKKKWLFLQSGIEIEEV